MKQELDNKLTKTMLIVMGVVSGVLFITGRVPEGYGQNLVGVIAAVTLPIAIIMIVQDVEYE